MGYSPDDLFLTQRSNLLVIFISGIKLMKASFTTAVTTSKPKIIWGKYYGSSLQAFQSYSQAILGRNSSLCVS